MARCIQNVTIHKITSSKLEWEQICVGEPFVVHGIGPISDTVFVKVSHTNYLCFDQSNNEMELFDISCIPDSAYFTVDENISSVTIDFKTL